jgi:hypothetical protein
MDLRKDHRAKKIRPQSPCFKPLCTAHANVLAAPTNGSETGWTTLSPACTARQFHPRLDAFFAPEPRVASPLSHARSRRIALPLRAFLD